MASDNSRKNKITEWLEKLQQESWQLEMIISGLAIALVGGLYDRIRQLLTDAAVWRHTDGITATFSGFIFVIFLGWAFLFANLCLHLLLRGLWISVLGLRYVSGEIDYHTLRYSKRFADFLSSRVGKFDDYILRLEKLCSIIFAFTFLIIFSLISFAAVQLFIVFFEYGVKSLFEAFFSAEAADKVSFVITLTFALLCLLYFIDFITLGFFKRRKRFFGWFFYVYRFIGIITFAWLYRPIYYNFIDNKYGRNFAYLLIPYVLIISLILSLNIETHKWFPEENRFGLAMSENNYADTADLQEGKYYVQITSRYIDNGYAEIFFPYLPEFQEDEILQRICPDVALEKTTGFHSSIVLDIKVGGETVTKESRKAAVERKEKSARQSLDCLQKMWRITLDDTLVTQNDFLFYQKDSRYGLKTILDVGHKKRGRHNLMIEKRNFPDVDDLIVVRRTVSDTIDLAWKKVAFIPFWKE